MFRKPERSGNARLLCVFLITGFTLQLQIEIVSWASEIKAEYVRSLLSLL